MHFFSVHSDVLCTIELRNSRCDARGTSAANRRLKTRAKTKLFARQIIRVSVGVKLAQQMNEPLAAVWAALVAQTQQKVYVNLADWQAEAASPKAGRRRQLSACCVFTFRQAALAV